MHRCKLLVAGPLIIRGRTPLRPMVSLNLAPLDHLGTTSCFDITLSHSLSLGTLDQPPVLISHFHFHSHLKTLEQHHTLLFPFNHKDLHFQFSNMFIYSHCINDDYRGFQLLTILVMTMIRMMKRTMVSNY